MCTCLYVLPVIICLTCIGNIPFFLLKNIVMANWGLLLLGLKRGKINRSCSRNIQNLGHILFLFFYFAIILSIWNEWYAFNLKGLMVVCEEQFRAGLLLERFSSICVIYFTLLPFEVLPWKTFFKKGSSGFFVATARQYGKMVWLFVPISSTPIHLHLINKSCTQRGV